MTADPSLSKLVAGAVGVLAFDENHQVVDWAGIGKDRVSDIPLLSAAEVDQEGFAVLRDGGLEVMLLREDGKTVAVYREVAE
ncbi:AaceriAER271Wp [[Ashbya] aceris (nom. inval.)]|nr:AaceriAER271Wp [[Ashbya] aceris (nom. inval.)]